MVPAAVMGTVVAVTVVSVVAAIFAAAGNCSARKAYHDSDEYEPSHGNHSFLEEPPPQY